MAALLAGLRRWTKRAIGLAALGLGALLAWGWARHHPQDLPWTPLDLAQPIGSFTGRKLTALGDDFAGCRAALDRAGVRYTVLPPVSAGQCGYADGLRFAPGGARVIRYAPAGVALACPLAAALAMWEWDVVQPAARRHFGQGVRTVDHYGSYACRRMYGRAGGAFSEHASANAIDIAGFRLADGSRVSVARDWHGAGAKAAFLHDVHAGACRLFATTLGPDYNAAHRDHFHLDQAARGAMGWRACR